MTDMRVRGDLMVRPLSGTIGAVIERPNISPPRLLRGELW